MTPNKSVPSSKRFPFPLPNGWFAVAYADEIKPGDVVPLRYFAKDLVLFRTEAGEAKVLDAYCPHLGAHLGHGGKVVGDAVECPFHAWRFNGAGQCLQVAYADKIPRKATIRCWEVVERNNFIYVWHHLENEPPNFDVPIIEEIGDPDWSSAKRFEWKIRTQNQEMGENAVDQAHFRYVHGTKTVPDTKNIIEGHIRRSISVAKMETPRGIVEGRIASEAHGVGIALVRFTGITETIICSSTIPIDEETVHIRFAFAVNTRGGASVDKGVGAAIIADIVKQLEEDIPIWENKRYLPRPMLCDGDGPIGQYRKWARQFYSV